MRDDVWHSLLSLHCLIQVQGLRRLLGVSKGTEECVVSDHAGHYILPLHPLEEIEYLPPLATIAKFIDLF